MSLSLRTLLLVLALLALACFLFVRFDWSTVEDEDEDEERIELRVGLPGHPWLAYSQATSLRGASPESMAESLHRTDEAVESIHGARVSFRRCTPFTLWGYEHRTTTLYIVSPSWLMLVAAGVLLFLRWDVRAARAARQDSTRSPSDARVR